MIHPDDPPFLSVGTEVSAKYKGAFCEAKVNKVVKNVKIRVNYKGLSGVETLSDEQIKGVLKSGSIVKALHPSKSGYLDATISKIQDCSQYTVVFDDGDITTLRRSSLCLKSGRHFAESESLDQLPLTHPEHFGSPVVGASSSGRGRRRYKSSNRPTGSDSESDESSEEEDDVHKTHKSRREEWEDDIGKIVCVEMNDNKKKQKDNWFPALVVAPTAQDTVRIDTRKDYLVRSFQDGRYYTVPKKEASAFTKEIGAKVTVGTLKVAVDKVLEYLTSDSLPPHWDRDLLFGVDNSEHETDATESDESDDEPREEKDHFVAQLYKYMEECNTPINKEPMIGNRDLDLYRLYKVVKKYGGYNKITNQQTMKHVIHKMNLHSLGAQAPALVKNAYRKYLSGFEDFFRKLGCTMSNTPRRIGRSRPRSGPGRSLIRDCDRVDKSPQYTASGSSSPAGGAEAEPVNLAGAVITVGGRGRPRGMTAGKRAGKDRKEEEEMEEREEVHFKTIKTYSRVTRQDRPSSQSPDRSNPTPPASSPIPPTPTTSSTKPMRGGVTEAKGLRGSRPDTPTGREGSEVRTRSKASTTYEGDYKSDSDTEDTADKAMETARTRSSRQKDEKETSSSASSTSSLSQKPPLSYGGRIKSSSLLHRKFSSCSLDMDTNDSDSQDNESTHSSEGTVSVRKRGRAQIGRGGGTAGGRAGGHSQFCKDENSWGDNSSSKMPSKRGRKKRETEAEMDVSVSKMGIAPSVPVNVGDKLLVLYGPNNSKHSKVTYEAKVLEVGTGLVAAPSQSTTTINNTMYYVHYQGWNTRYDEWIKRCRIAKNLTHTPPARTRKDSVSSNSSQSPLPALVTAVKKEPCGVATSPPPSTPKSKAPPTKGKGAAEGETVTRRSKRKAARTDEMDSNSTDSLDSESDAESDSVEVKEESESDKPVPEKEPIVDKIKEEKQSVETKADCDSLSCSKDIDLKAIESEMKGLDHRPQSTVKKEVDVSTYDGPKVIQAEKKLKEQQDLAAKESVVSPSKKQEGVCSTPPKATPSKEQLLGRGMDLSDDIYEFKEPEPFEIGEMRSRKEALEMSGKLTPKKSPRNDNSGSDGEGSAKKVVKDPKESSDAKKVLRKEPDIREPLGVLAKVPLLTEPKEQVIAQSLSVEEQTANEQLKNITPKKQLPGKTIGSLPKSLASIIGTELKVVKVDSSVCGSPLTKLQQAEVVGKVTSIASHVMAQALPLTKQIKAVSKLSATLNTPMQAKGVEETKESVPFIKRQQQIFPHLLKTPPTESPKNVVVTDDSLQKEDSSPRKVEPTKQLPETTESKSKDKESLPSSSAKTPMLTSSVGASIESVIQKATVRTKELESDALEHSNDKSKVPVIDKQDTEKEETSNKSIKMDSTEIRSSGAMVAKKQNAKRSLEEEDSGKEDEGKNPPKRVRSASVLSDSVDKKVEDEEALGGLLCEETIPPGSPLIQEDGDYPSKEVTQSSDDKKYSAMPSFSKDVPKAGKAGECSKTKETVEPSSSVATTSSSSSNSSSSPKPPEGRILSAVEALAPHALDSSFPTTPESLSSNLSDSPLREEEVIPKEDTDDAYGLDAIYMRTGTSREYKHITRKTTNNAMPTGLTVTVTPRDEPRPPTRKTALAGSVPKLPTLEDDNEEDSNQSRKSPEALHKTSVLQTSTSKMPTSSGRKKKKYAIRSHPYKQYRNELDGNGLPRPLEGTFKGNSPPVGRFNFLKDINHLSRVKRIEELTTRISDMRKVYAECKSSVTSMEKKMKKLRKRERENRDECS